MSLDQVEPLRRAFLARRAAPPVPMAERRAAFEAQMAAIPLPSRFVADPVTITSALGGLMCRAGPDVPQRLLVWLHGGAFVLGSAASYRPLAARMAAAGDIAVLLPDYRLAPEHVFPAALDDVRAVLEWLQATGHAMHDIAIGGDSAGANLALAAVQAHLAAGRPAPAALWLVSPYLDLTHSGASIRARADLDPFVDPATMEPTARTYLGNAAPDDTRASPLFGSMRGLPPVLIQAGSDEVLFDDAARLRDAIGAEGGRAVFQEWAGMIHVWPLFAHAIDEGGWAIAQGGNFLRRALADAAAIANRKG